MFNTGPMDSTIMAVLNDGPATYNGRELEIMIDTDVEVETEGGAFIKVTTATFRSGFIDKVRPGDIVRHNNIVWEVRQLNEDDGKIKVVTVSKK